MTTNPTGRFPFVDVAEALAPADRPAHGERVEPLRVLIVDDDPSVCRALARLLGRDARVKTTQAGDGLEALKILESENFELVISDEVMPHVNGVRLLETIRARWPGTRRVLFTGHPNAELVMAAVNRGGLDKALAKGMPPTQLQEELGEVVDECFAGRLSAAPRGYKQTIQAKAPGEERSTVLIAADELALRGSYVEALRGAGYEAVPCALGELRERVSAVSPAVVLIDLSGASASVVELMHELRAVDLECLVVVTAPRGSLGDAQRAMQYGAYRYLVYPVPRDALLQVVGQALKLHHLAELRARAQAGQTEDAAWRVGDLAALEVRFQQALELLFMVYQPIVRWSERKIIGYEALVRSEEPAMPHPGALFDAATRLGRVAELGRAIRALSPVPIRDRTSTEKLFLNLHVDDLQALDVLEGDLRDVAGRTVLEISERAGIGAIHTILPQLASLRARGFQIAVDDIGAGYAGLSSFAVLEPDVVKVDMSLVRGIHEAPVKRRLVASLADACRDLGVDLIAEGVETVEERDALIAIGCDLFQGFLFARPARPFPEVRWG